jgi:hypothetical protein
MTNITPTAADAPLSDINLAGSPPDAPAVEDLLPDRAEDDDDDAVDILTAIAERYWPRELRPGLTIFVPWNVFMPEKPDIVAVLENDIGPDGRTEWERLSDLVANIHAIAAGETPVSCPAQIEHWWVEASIRGYPARCLRGVATRHPTLPTPARRFCSSTLIAIAPAEHWALTISSFYELGSPLQ